MNTFIELTEKETGRKVLINVSGIVTVMQYDTNHSKIELQGSTIFCKESYQEVKPMLVLNIEHFMP